MIRDRKSTRLNSSHTVIYTLSLHDALPIYHQPFDLVEPRHPTRQVAERQRQLTFLVEAGNLDDQRSEEHTSELQSHSDLHSFPTRRSSDLSPAIRPRRTPPPDAAGG